MTWVWVAAAALLVAAGLVGNNRLVVTRYRVELPGLRPPAGHVSAGRGTPAARARHAGPASRLRIVHLSDLHGKRFGRGERDRLVRTVRGCLPDLIAVSGDVLDHRRDVTTRAIEELRALAAIAPVVVCRGNHDLCPRQWDELGAALRGEAVHLLQNDLLVLQVAGVPLVVAGVEERAVYREDEEAWLAALGDLADRASACSHPRILLAHRPDYISRYAKTGFALSLSGHAHGGQVRIPGVGALWAPDQGFLPRHAEGIHQSDGFTAVVSRGLGPSTFPFRIANPPQVILLECEPSGS